MKAEIALVTVSGKAYYRLVKELKGRNLPFLSLTPRDHIPLDIKVVITTQEERHLIKHPNILVFKDEGDAAVIVDEAIRAAQGKLNYDRVVIGVDPGKTFGIAVLADGNILETHACSDLEETKSTILKALDKTPATMTTIKIGNGAPLYAKELLYLLDEAIPKGVVIETVSEAGTSRFVKGTIHRRGARDLMSAMKIAERKGRVFPRKGMK
ncbi:MAG: hypothetical protein ACE5OW_07010 [Candidatus Bathyarchaeia archaeon]